MLTDKDIAALNNCLLGTHLLLEIELNVVTEESSNLRSRLHSGDDLTCSELMALPYSESLIVKKITDTNDIQWLTAYAIANGRDLQSLFETSDFTYLTLFIDNENVSPQFKEWLTAYDLIDAFQSSKATGITISFPEKHIQTKERGDTMNKPYDTALEFVNEIIERDIEGQKFRAEGKDGICKWTAKDTGDAYRWLNGYVKALEDNALITDEQLESLQKKIISLSGWGAPKVQSDLLDIQSASELTANAIIDNCNVKVILGNDSKA